MPLKSDCCISFRHSTRTIMQMCDNYFELNPILIVIRLHGRAKARGRNIDPPRACCFYRMCRTILFSIVLLSSDIYKHYRKKFMHQISRDAYTKKIILNFHFLINIKKHKKLNPISQSLISLSLLLFQ